MSCDSPCASSSDVESVDLALSSDSHSRNHNQDHDRIQGKNSVVECTRNNKNRNNASNFPIIKLSLSPDNFLMYATCTVIIIGLWCSAETSAMPAPSSPWNQSGLNLIFKTDLRSSKGKPNGNSNGNSPNSSKDKEKVGGSDKVHLNGIPSHSWGYTRYGHGQDIGHFRHASSKKHFIPNNKSVPCPRDYIRLYNGKCRRIPSFSSSRVG